MNRIDRAVARALAHLRDGEVLVTSTVGYEDEGRRRQVVLVTDRRVVVAGSRSEPSVDLVLAGTTATYDPQGGRLLLERAGEVRAVVRAVEATAARQVVSVLDDHRTMPDVSFAPRVQHVHIRDDDPADG